MSVSVVACDTGPILHLHEANSLDLLARLGSIYLPRQVHRELNYIIPDWRIAEQPFLKVVEVEGGFSEYAASWANAGLLHKGEAEALALALQIKAAWFLTDDAAARVLAESLNVETHGSLGVVLWAAANGHVSREEGTVRLEALFRSSLWVSPSVQAKARVALQKIYARL